jgi:hypothetical protein
MTPNGLFVAHLKGLKIVYTTHFITYCIIRRLTGDPCPVCRHYSRTRCIIITLVQHTLDMFHVTTNPPSATGRKPVTLQSGHFATCIKGLYAHQMPSGSDVIRVRHLPCIICYTRLFLCALVICGSAINIGVDFVCHRTTAPTFVP